MTTFILSWEQKGSTHRGFLAQALLEPSLHLIQSEINPNQSKLPTSLDELIWLHH